MAPTSVNNQKLPLGDGTSHQHEVHLGLQHTFAVVVKTAQLLSKASVSTFTGVNHKVLLCKDNCIPAKAPVQGPHTGFGEPSIGRTSPAPTNAPGFSSKESY